MASPLSSGRPFPPAGMSDGEGEWKYVPSRRQLQQWQRKGWQDYSKKKSADRRAAQQRAGWRPQRRGERALDKARSPSSARAAAQPQERDDSGKDKKGWRTSIPPVPDEFRRCNRGPEWQCEMCEESNWRNRLACWACQSMHPDGTAH